MEGKEVKPRFKKGFWKPEEDLILKKYVETHGEGNWTAVSKKSGLLRGAKSCRLRWKNYLRPNIKRGMISEDERDLIIRLHKLLGNRWSLIAGRLPGRTDNEVKNYWNTHLNKRDQISHLDSQNENKRQLSVSSHNVQNKNLHTVEEAEGDSIQVEENLKINVDDSTMNTMPPQLISPNAPDYSPLFFHNYEAFCMPVMDPFEDHIIQKTIFQFISEMGSM